MGEDSIMQIAPLVRGEQNNAPIKRCSSVAVLSSFLRLAQASTYGPSSLREYYLVPRSQLNLKRWLIS